MNAVINVPKEWTERYAEGGQLKFHRAVGCAKCNKTGYKGRIGLHELMIADEPAKSSFRNAPELPSYSPGSSTVACVL